MSKYLARLNAIIQEKPLPNQVPKCHKPLSLLALTMVEVLLELIVSPTQMKPRLSRCCDK